MLPYSSSERLSPPALNYEPPQTPLHKRPAVILGGILGLIVLAGVAFATYYMFFRVPVPNISVQVRKPDRVLVGEPFKLTVEYANSSDQALQDAVVALTVPEGVAIIGVEPSTRLVQQSVGELNGQAIGSKTFDLMVTGGENSVKNISLVFRYRLKEGRSTLEKSADASIPVGGSAVSLNFDVPQNVFLGQSFDASVSYQNNSQTSFQNAKLVFDYPQMFQFESSSDSPSNGKNEWDLGTLAPAAQGSVTVTGKAAGGQQSFFALGVHLQVELGGQRYDLGAQTATIGIQSTPLALSITVNRKADYVASLGDNLSYELTYYNGSGFSLQNVVIKAALQGEMFDLGTLRSAADLDSVDNALTWNTANTPKLANVGAREDGSVEFKINLKKEWPIQSPTDKDFAVQVDADIRSLTVPAGITAQETISKTSVTTKLAGSATIASLAYFKEPGGSIQNSGPYPPRVNQPTQYTIHWQVRNHSTDIGDVRLSALLQSGARMVKAVKSNTGTLPVYDSRTGQVTWDIPSIAATRGLLSEPAEAIFQIEATPAVNQIGRDFPLMSETTFSARDRFTNTLLQEKALAKTSNLPDDSQAYSGDRKVQP